MNSKNVHLDHRNEINAIDRSRMRNLLEGFPQHLESAWKLGADAKIPSFSFEHVLVCGMGGSAIGGDFLRVYLQQKGFPKPIGVVRSYELPPFADERTLVFCLSYSGNTEETLSCFEDAGRRGCARAAITSGGRLAQLAREAGVPLVEIPGGMPPRTALGYLFGPLLRSLLPTVEPRNDVEREFEEAVSALQRRASLYGVESPEEQNPAKRLARALLQKIPVIYGSGLTESVARRWKTQINENAKQPAHWDVLPELHHNEIVGWESPLAERFVYVLLRDPEEHPQIQKRFRITRTLLEERGRAVLEVHPPEEETGVLARLLTMSYLGDWVSYYLALLQGVDPTPVALIDEMKRRLAQH